jgi:hypothetical protein
MISLLWVILSVLVRNDEDDENISLMWEDSEMDGAGNAVVC